MRGVFRYYFDCLDTEESICEQAPLGREELTDKSIMCDKLTLSPSAALLTQPPNDCIVNTVKIYYFRQITSVIVGVESSSVLSRDKT